jgi:hypothetical protein
MAIEDKPKKKATKTSFQKGVSGNPEGRPPMSADTKKLMDLTKSSYREIALKYLNMSKKETLALKENDEMSMLEWAFVKCILVIHKKGDYATLDKMMDRVIGKVKDEVDLTVNPHDELMALIRKKNGTS